MGVAVRLREQIATVLKDGPLNLIEISTRLQQRAGIRPVKPWTEKSVENASSSTLKKKVMEHAQRIKERYQVLCDHGYTFGALHRILREDGSFEPVFVEVSAGDGKAKKTMMCWRNK